MANYAVTDYDTGNLASVTDVLAALETKLETIDAAKTIRLIGIEKAGTGGFVGYLIYDA